MAASWRLIVPRPWTKWFRIRIVAVYISMVAVTGLICMYIASNHQVLNSRYGTTKHHHSKNGEYNYETFAKGAKEQFSAGPCTPDVVGRRGKKIVLTSTNAAFIDFTDNWLESVRRTRACPSVTIVAEDDDTMTYYSNKTARYAGLTVVKTDSGVTLSDKLTFDTDSFKRFVNKRQTYILSYLLKGFEVLFTDVDTFWFRDPFAYFSDKFDIAVEEDKAGFYCAGFVYFKPTNRTIRFLKHWIDFMHRDEKLQPDQVVMNKLIDSKTVPELKIKVLASANFPNGKVFFDEAWRTSHAKDIVVAHNNWIVGHDSKVERFKNCGMWLVGNNSENSTRTCIDV